MSEAAQEIYQRLCILPVVKNPADYRTRSIPTNESDARVSHEYAESKPSMLSGIPLRHVTSQLTKAVLPFLGLVSYDELVGFPSFVREICIWIPEWIRIGSSLGLEMQFQVLELRHPFFRADLNSLHRWVRFNLLSCVRFMVWC